VRGERGKKACQYSVKRGRGLAEEREGHEHTGALVPRVRKSSRSYDADLMEEGGGNEKNEWQMDGRRQTEVLFFNCHREP